jgi:error-prone DNA polymerase
VFLLLEDEFGTINLIVPPDVYERHRLTVRMEPLILAHGRLEKLAMAGGAINVFVKTLEALVTPDEDVAGVVELAQRRAAAAAPEAPADRTAAGADPSAILADFRGVAPAVQSFAAGRRK